MSDYTAETPNTRIPSNGRIIGIDFSTTTVGIAEIAFDFTRKSGESGESFIDFRNAFMLDIPSKFKKYSGEIRPFAIGNHVKAHLESRGINHAALDETCIFVYELPYIDPRHNSAVLPLGFAGGVAVSRIVGELFAKNRLESHFMLLTPANLKKLGTANRTHPFTSGNGHAEKIHIAEKMRDVFQLSDYDFLSITTLSRPRSTPTVYDATDALGLTYSAHSILSALYHGHDVPKKAPPGIKKIVKKYKSIWE